MRSRPATLGLSSQPTACLVDAIRCSMPTRLRLGASTAAAEGSPRRPTESFGRTVPVVGLRLRLGVNIVLAMTLASISLGVATAQGAAGATVASAPPLTIGAPASGGGQNIDFWRIPLIGGDKVSVAASLPSHDVSGWPYKFDLFAPETADSSFGQVFPVSEASVEVGGAATQYVAVQAPYTGTFVLAVCEYPNTGCQALAGQARVMDPYTFTTSLENGGVGASAAALEKRAGETIASAKAIRTGTFQAGGGQNIDFWKVTLEAGEKLTVAASLPKRDVSGWPYKFDLFAPKTADSTFKQAVPVSEGSLEVGGAATQYTTLRAPYAGTFVLAVCEYPNTGCQALAGQARVMIPYTFTTTAHPSPAALRKRKLAAALRKCSELQRSKRAACIRLAHRHYG